VRAGSFPLDGEEERLRWASASEVDLPSLGERLVSAFSLGPGLADLLARPSCEALGCGFVPRCHPPERGL